MALLKGVTQKNSRKFRASYAPQLRMITPDDRAACPILGKKAADGELYEQKLVRHIRERLRLADVERRLRAQRCTDIDVQLSGIVKLEGDDRKNDAKNKRGRAPKPIKHNLPLAYSQLDDMVTYLMSVYAPDMDIFSATASADKQPIAEGLNEVVSKQAQLLQYYRNLAKFCLNAVKHNFGAMSITWEKATGTIYQPDQQAGGQIKKTQGTIWEGNVVKACDNYNFLYDTSVHPVDLPLRGEFFAEVEIYTPFRVLRMAEQNILFGTQRWIDTGAPPTSSDSGTYYIAPPILREPIQTDASGGVTNWSTILNPGGPARTSQPSLEVIWYTTWIKPCDFGISDEKNLCLYRIAMAQGVYIAATVKLEDSHGQLPVACGTPIEDDCRNDQRTYAEQLLPLQHFASFLLNTHVDASRKAIYGITVFDANAFPGMDMSTEDLIGARIPMKSSITGIDIDKAFRHYNDAPNTDQNVEMVGKIAELMQKILPTDQARVVADLQRATEYQAAATVQAASRRNLKIARILSDQALSVTKFQMLYNIYAHVTVIEYADPGTGQMRSITPQQLITAQLEFDIGSGLKGLDRMQQVGLFKDIMVYLFQMKDINQKVDVLGLLSYVVEMAGFKTDLSRFKLTPPAPTDINKSASAAAPAPDQTATAPQNAQPNTPQNTPVPFQTRAA